MEHQISAGTILIKNGAPLPEDLQFESEPGVPGWRFVKDFDAKAMNEAIQKSGWTYFCVAGEIKATVFGIDSQRMVRTAIKRILANPQLENCNSLEITQVVSNGSNRFPRVLCVSVFAQSRQIQESMFLGRERARPELKTQKIGLPAKAPGIAPDAMPLSREPAKNARVAPV